jgi:hypothetical protein
MEQSDIRAAVRIIFNTRDFRRYAFLIPTKIYDAITALMSTASMPDSQFAKIVAAAFAFERSKQGALRFGSRNFLVSQNRHLPASRRSRLEFSNRHVYPPGR